MGGWLKFLVTPLSVVSQRLLLWSCLEKPWGNVAQTVQSNIYKTLFGGWVYCPLVADPLLHLADVASVLGNLDTTWNL